VCSCVRVMFVATGRVVGGMGVSSAQCWHLLQCSFVGASKSVGGCRFVRCDLKKRIVVLPCPLRVPLFRRLWR
jgi:hypothetical protein